MYIHTHTQYNEGYKRLRLDASEFSPHFFTRYFTNKNHDESKFSCKLPQFHSPCTLSEINLSQNLQIFMIPILFDAFSSLTI
jgi:hypothetical protein